MADLTLQNFIIARLADFCDYRARWSEDMQRDPVGRLLRKLDETKTPVATLKQQLLDDTTASFIDRVTGGQLGEQALADYKQLLDAYLTGGDFADAAFHLDAPTLEDPARREGAIKFLRALKAHVLVAEIDRPEGMRSKKYEKLVGEMYQRLDYPCLEQLAAHKTLNARRLHTLLTRARHNSYEYATVFRFPTHEGDGFTPFILPRVEGLIAANERLLRTMKSG